MKKKLAKRIIIIGSVCIVAIVIGTLLKLHNELFFIIVGCGGWILLELCFWITVNFIFGTSINSKFPSPNQIKEQK